MSWSNDPKVQELCRARIHEVIEIEDPLRRYKRALEWIEYLGAYPQEAGNRPTTYTSTLAAAAQAPSMYKRLA